MEDATKRCPACGIDLPLEQFSRDKTRRDGRFPYCRPCFRKRQNERAKRLRLAGCCVSCGSAAAANGSTRCKPCDAKRGSVAAGQRALSLGSGLCRICHKRPIAAGNSQYCESHREYARLKAREHASSPRGKATAARRLERTPPETIRGWQRNSAQRYRARKAAATVVPFTQSQLAQRLAYFGGLCWMCGGPGEQVDHVKPLSKGGAHCLANLRPACARCNNKKRAMWPLSQEVLRSRLSH